MAHEQKFAVVLDNNAVANIQNIKSNLMKGVMLLDSILANLQPIQDKKKDEIKKEQVARQEKKNKKGTK